MLKRILSVVITLCLGLSTLTFTACSKDIKIIEPESGYKVEIGGTIELEVETNAKEFSFEIIAGSEYVDWISEDGELKVVSGGKELVGKTIDLVATSGKSKSNKITITVLDIPLAEIIDLSIPFGYVFPGESVEISYLLQPQNTTQDDILFEIVSGSGGSIEGNMLTISPTTPEGTIIIRAKRGEVVSENLEIEVRYPGQTDYEISGEQEITVYSGSENKTSVKVMDRAGNLIENVLILFEVTSGGDNIVIEEKGYDINIEVLGHGYAEITAMLENGKSHIIKVNSIKTPTRLELPAYLKDKAEYKVGINQPFDFRAVVPSDIDNHRACKDIAYTIITDDDKDAGTFVDGKITFTKTGKIKVVAKSNSGNINGEVSTFFVFDVNDGINVFDWNSLKTALEDKNNNAKTINLVVTQLAKFSSGKLADDYNIIPTYILNNNNDSATYIDQNSITVKNSISINANNHAIDLRGLKYNDEFKAQSLPALLNFVSNEQTEGYKVTIKDLSIFGNVNIDGVSTADTTQIPTNNLGLLSGVHSSGISIGELGKAAYYDVELDNIKVYNFNQGISIVRAKEGSKASNLYISNCFAFGMELEANIIELSNISFGACGGGGIDAKSGKLEGEQAQKITLLGSMDAASASSGNSKYLSGLKLDQYTISDIIGAVLSQLSPVQVSHIANQNNEFKILMFALSDFSGAANHTQVACSSCISINDIDDKVISNAKFIEIPLSLPQPYGNIGKIIVQNWNCQP